MVSDPLSFPPEFVFGVATSAYQCEGNIENDWSDWERAGRLKEPLARCGRAVDHWNRFEEDLALAKSLGARAFRLSLEWARLEPRPGEFDDSAIAAYRERLRRMAQVGLRPMVTLHHFTHPSWFHQSCPWHDRSSIEAFRRYARVCARIIADLDALVLTFNEPMVLLLGGYLQGSIPPGFNDSAKALEAISNISSAHVAAREEILTACGPRPIGIAQNLMAFAADRRWHPLDHTLCRVAAYNYNHALLEALVSGRLQLFMPGLLRVDRSIPKARGSLDFIGVNYYTRTHLRFIWKRPFVDFAYRDKRSRGLTAIGWEDFPEGFGQVLREVKRYGLPVWITENGIDDRSGNRRPHFLHAHWKQVLRAIKDGVDIRGYLYWSLLDNFEWLEGWGPRFGLYRVDFETLERTPTAACAYFRETAQSRLLKPPSLEPTSEAVAA